MRFPILSYKKAGLFLGLCLGILLVVLWSSQPTVLAQKVKPGTPNDPPPTDLKKLKDTFAGNQVSVFFLNNNPPAAMGQIAAVETIFGRRYLRLTNNEGKAWLIDVERIVAIRQN